jgi:uncharacterized protein (DUF2164 family)
VSQVSSRIKLSKEDRDKMVALIREYFLNERELDLGDLAASLILEFFVEKLAATFYNQGVYDAYSSLSERIEDLLALQIYTCEKYDLHTDASE